MDLITALKSGRRIRNRNISDLGEWFSVRTEEFVFPLHAILSDTWEVEPEPPKPIVFECLWSVWGANGPIYPHDDDTGISFKSLVGKRTKVTLEILD